MVQDESSEEAPMMRIRRAGGAMIAGYMRVFKNTMATNEAKYLHNFHEIDLIERRAWLVPATARTTNGAFQVVGGFYCVIDGARTARIQGLVLNPDHRRNGLIRALLSDTIASLVELGAVDAVEVAVRVLPDGSKNEKAHRLFSGLGLFDTEIGTARIAGTYHDQHLRQTAEPGGETYRFLRMRGEGADLLRRDWN